MKEFRFDPTNLAAVVEAANLPMEQAAKNIGIGYQSLLKYYHGILTPGTEAVVKMADYFAVPVDFLLGRCDKKTAEAILHNYAETFILLRRAPWEAYLRTQHKNDPVTAEEYLAPWPYNLLDDIGREVWHDVLTEDQERGLDQALNMLTEREQKMVRMYYECGQSFRDIAKAQNLSGERVRQIVARGIRKLRHPTLFNLVRYGADGMMQKNAINNRMEELEEAKDQIKAIEETLAQRTQDLAATPDPMDLPLDAMYLNTRTHNALMRRGIRTVRDVAERLKGGNMLQIRNIGKKGLDEVLVKVQIMTGEDYRDLYYGGDGNAAV